MYVFQYERIVVCLSEVMTVHVCVRIIMYEFKCSSWPARGAAVPGTELPCCGIDAGWRHAPWSAERGSEII